MIRGELVIGYYLFLVFGKIIMLFPRSFRKAFFTGLADLAYLIDRKHRRIILQNLHFALGNSCTADEEEAISRYCYRNLLLALLQVIEGHYLSKKKLGELVTFKNTEVVESARSQGRPIIFISAHYGNWELGSTALSSQIMPTTAIHKKLNNPYFEDYLLKSRSRFDMHMVEKRGAIKYLTKALKQNKAIGLLVDQNTHKRDGIIINFFGKTARQTAAPAFLARKYNAVIIPLSIDTDDEEFYTITFENAIEVDHTDNAEADILKATQEQANAIEKIILKNPKFWFWCHRRWKTEHPEIYR